MRITTYCLTGLLLSGCVVGPDYQRPTLETPKQWSKQQAKQTTATIDVKKWWYSFNDPTLNQLIVDAIATNLDLKQTLERIKDARAQHTITVASGLPSFSTRNNINRRLNSTASTNNGTQAGGFGFGGSAIDLLQMGIDAQWELDFFGGVQRALEAADANIDSEIENRRDILITLLGDVARNYIELRANQQLVQIVKDKLNNQQETLNLLKVRRQAGLTDDTEIAQAEAELANIQAQLPNYQTAIQQAIHALSVLLAKQPQALTTRLEKNEKIPITKNQIILELPSTLLQRRPDIRYAERQLAVANAQIGIAETELYPKFNLAEFIGLQNTRITDITMIGKSWSVGTTLTMPLFNWGKINANIKSKEALYQQQLITYQKTVLIAFKEVEDALIAYDQEQQKQQSIQQALNANKKALQLATERYEKGLNNFISVLNSQQALYQTQTELINSTAKLSADLVVLYKVLGGGWQNF